MQTDSKPKQSPDLVAYGFFFDPPADTCTMTFPFPTRERTGPVSWRSWNRTKWQMKIPSLLVATAIHSDGWSGCSVAVHRPFHASMCDLFETLFHRSYHIHLPLRPYYLNTTSSELHRHKIPSDRLHHYQPIAE